jgi:pSer/pThr/pTyr-binding forkhead associated (FHA) protein
VLAPQQARAAGLVVEAPAEPARIVVLSSPALAAGDAFDVGPVPLTVGRSDDNAVALRRDEFASAHHARLEALRDGVWLVDLGSTNGIDVNGRRQARAKLSDGDRVVLGTTEVVFRQEQG